MCIQPISRTHQKLWVIVGSVIGALVVFVVLSVILWKVSMPIHVIFIKYLQIYSKARNIAKMILPKLYSYP